MNLSGKICLVTGGSRGIGESIVRKLAAHQARVIFTYARERDLANHMVAELSEKGQSVMCMFLDVADRTQVENLVREIGKQYNRLDVLVNNAGINKPTDFDQISDEDWDLIIDVNLKGPFMLTQAALPLLKNSTKASVINIGSVSGQYGGPRTAHYAVSKAGLISLGQVIARYGAQYNIRCNTIAAGLIQSEMADAGLQNSPAVQKALEGIVLGRMGSKEEVAEVVSFLASDSSSYITAQTINVNGGLYF